MQQDQTISRVNPKNLAAPVGHYSHVTKIPSTANLYTFSGQIGTDSDGQLPLDLASQVTNTFRNIEAVLASEKLAAEDIIKVNIWATEPLDWDFFYAQWDAFFANDFPSMTVGYLVALGLPEIKLEIEIWAAK